MGKTAHQADFAAWCAVFCLGEFNCKIFGARKERDHGIQITGVLLKVLSQ